MLDFSLQKRAPGHEYNLLPTLLPNFSPNVVSRGLHHISPEDYPEVTSPRVASTGSFAVSGVPAAGTATVTITNGVLGTVPVSVAVAITATDTLTQAIIAIINAINATEALNQFYFQAYPTADGSGIGIAQPSGVGNYSTIALDPGTTAIAVTATTQMSGGSGAIIPLNNFNFNHNNANIPFWYGIPRDVGSSLLASLVSNNVPIC